MYVISGEHEGLWADPSAYGDDWIAAYSTAGEFVVLEPLHVQLSTEEIGWFQRTDRVSQAGGFWTAYALSGNRFQHVRSQYRGGLVQPSDAGQVDPSRATTQIAHAAPIADHRDDPPDPVARNSAAADMLTAVRAGSVAFRHGRSCWTSGFHAMGFKHLGRDLTGHLWGRVEHNALEHVANLGLVALRSKQYWALTPAGGALCWRWSRWQDQATQLDEPSLRG